MRFPVYTIFILLMLLGNGFAVYKMFTAKQEFFDQFPNLTETAFKIFRLVPVINIIALAGMLLMRPWAVYLVIACGIAVIAFDIYFGIWYHLYVAIPSSLILLFFIIKYWNEFK